MTERPELKLGRVVLVDDGVNPPWAGLLVSLKPTPDTWWAEVRRNDDLLTWAVPVHMVTQPKEEA